MKAVATSGRDEAEALLLANGSELGLLGSNQAYRQVWSRDSMLCGLGLVLCRDPEGTAIFRRSLETLRRYQSPLGRLPHNVGVPNLADPALVAHGGRLEGDDEVVLDTAHAGCVDNNLWYVLGHYVHFVATGDRPFLSEAWPSLERALTWLRYQDSNECGLLEVHEAMDWSDLLANRYNVLYDNVLFAGCWGAMGRMAAALGRPDDEHRENARDVRHKINVALWIGPEEPKDWNWIAGRRKEWAYTLRRVETELVERPFYLPYLAFRDYGDRFDTLGNLLAVLLGVADEVKANRILDYLQGCGLDDPYPVRALYPPIGPGEKDWRDYYRVRNLNLPNHYHNGGAWPFIGGLYVAALVHAGRHDQAREAFDRLTEMVRQGRQREWEFNEWHHGLSGRPMGYGGQSWSTAMYLYAHDAVTRGRAAIFDPADGWDAGA